MPINQPIRLRVYISFWPNECRHNSKIERTLTLNNGHFKKNCFKTINISCFKCKCVTLKRHFRVWWARWLHMVTGNDWGTVDCRPAAPEVIVILEGEDIIYTAAAFMELQVFNHFPALSLSVWITFQNMYSITQLQKFQSYLKNISWCSFAGINCESSIPLLLISLFLLV